MNALDVAKWIDNNLDKQGTPEFAAAITRCSGLSPLLHRPCKTRTVIYSWILPDPHSEGVKGAPALKCNHFAGHSISPTAALLAEVAIISHVRARCG